MISLESVADSIEVVEGAPAIILELCKCIVYGDALPNLALGAPKLVVIVTC